MSRYAVEFTTAAAREVRKLDPLARRRILESVPRLADDPRPVGVKKLVGTSGWRLRVGDHRVLYDISESTITIVVFKVGHRRDL